MARGLQVFVDIGARVGSSVGASASAVERRFAAMGRTLKVASAETSAHLAATEKRFGKMSRNFQTFAQSASLPMAGVIAMGGRTAYQFERVGNELQGIAEMSDVARKKIEGVARAMPGRAEANLGAAVDLARTGFSATGIEGSLATVVKLAGSERGMDTESAADIASNVMVGMKLFDETMTAKQVGDQFAKVSDRIAFGAAKSSSDIRLMGESFKYAGPLASRLGNDMDQLAAAFMVMADAGIKGSESGIAVRSMMVRMLRPTKAGQAMLDRMGVNINDFVTMKRKATGADISKGLLAQGINASGQASAIDAALASGLDGGALIERITDIVSKCVGGAMDRDKISDGVSNALLAGADKADMFGLIRTLIEKGATTADILQFVDTRQGARLATLFDKDKKTGKSVLDSKLALVKSGAPGFLTRQYDQATKGVVGSFMRLQSSFDNLIITMARTGVIDAAASAMEGLAKGMDRLSKASPALLKFGTIAAIAVAAMAPLGFVIGGIAAGVRVLGGSLMFLGRIGGAKILQTLGTVALSFGRAVGIGIRGLAAGFGGMARMFGPMIFRSLAGLASFVVRGLALAFIGLTPAGWGVIIAGAGAALIWAFRKQIAEAWPKVVDFFKTAGARLRDTFMAINWAGVGMAIADRLTFGLASKLPALFATANGGGRGQYGAALAAMSPPVARTPSALVAANSNTPGGHLRSVSVGQIVVQGARSPHETAQAVRQEIRRMAAGQRGSYHD